MKTNSLDNIDSSANENIKKLASLIKDIKFAMVTSTNSDHQLQSCPLTTQQVEFDGDLWFIVGRNSEVVANIQATPQVNASFSSDDGKYISVSGYANLVEDRLKLEEFWNDSYKTWFPDGIGDPNITLMKITVERAEYWQSPAFKVVKMLAMAKAYLTGHQASLSEHHKISLN